jgi:hypothetical protein
MAMEITEGYYGDLRLDGLRVAGVYHWPGPMHEGKGTWWSIVDKAASEEQVEALFTILGGDDQEPTTGFAIYGSTVEFEPDPLFADIEFEWDIEGRTGRFHPQPGDRRAALHCDQTTPGLRVSAGRNGERKLLGQ